MQRCELSSVKSKYESLKQNKKKKKLFKGLIFANT